MLISRGNDGRIIGWRETYISKDEIADVAVGGIDAQAAKT